MSHIKDPANDAIKEMVAAEQSKISATRRDLHKIPERGFKEEKTAQYLAARLKEIEGLKVTTGVAGTGILAELSTGRPGKTLLIRADMDALPITEETGLPFASTHNGTMHACGHDGNMAMGLGAARILSKIKDQLSGTVKFMFQPAEEGPGGAKPMIEAGILENPRVDYATACHLWPGLPEGTLGVKPGTFMAAASVFEIEITGKGGHGAMPHLCVDALDTATQVVNALQRVVSRKLNPLTPSVVTVGSLHAGEAPNAIPERASIKGTTRTYDKEIWESYPDILEPVVKGVCESMGAEYTFKFIPGYPPLTNDAGMVETMKTCMADVVGTERIMAQESTMGGEDISFVFEKTRGCYFFLGTGWEGCAPLHNGRFDFDDSLLTLGVEAFVRYTLTLLGTSGS